MPKKKKVCVKEEVERCVVNISAGRGHGVTPRLRFLVAFESAPPLRCRFRAIRTVELLSVEDPWHCHRPFLMARLTDPEEQRVETTRNQPVVST